MLQLELKEMLPCSARREQKLRELVRGMMHQVLPTLGLVLQQVVQALQALHRVYEQLVVIGLVVIALAQQVRLELAQREWQREWQLVWQLVWLLQEQLDLLLQALNLVPKYLEELQALVLEEFHP
jgi:hypothetical protein